MKTKMRWILGILLSLTLVLGLMTGMNATAYAEGEYDIWVSGIRVTDGNMDNVLGDDTVSFEPFTTTMTLNNANISESYSDANSDANIFYNGTKPLNIVLEGKNNLSLSASGQRPCNIYSSSGNITISGDGSLSANAPDYVIYAPNADVTIVGGDITITADGAVGIYAKNISISGGTVTANQVDTGISCVDNLSISGGSVNVSGFYNAIEAYHGTVTIEGGRVTASTKDISSPAIFGKVKNHMAGKGWDNADGSGTPTTIEVNTTTGQDLSYKKVEFIPHTHSFTYAAGTFAQANIITATCSADGCTLPPSSEGGTDHAATLTINAPEHSIVGDGKDPAAVIIDEYNIKGDAKVQYYTLIGDTYGTASETPPTAAGDYKATITVGGATAAVEYSFGEIYPLWIDGWRVNSSNKDDVLGDEDGQGATVTFTPANGNTSAILTLTGANITGNTSGVSICYQGTEPLNIVLEGSNTISLSASGRVTYGIYSVGDITISGPGSLSSNACAYGIYASGADVTIEGGDINIPEGINVGIQANNLSISGGTVNVSVNLSHAIMASGTVTIEDGRVTASTASESPAISGTVKNHMAGKGWDNADGSGTPTTIEVNTTTGQDLSYKKVEFIPHTHSFTYTAGTGDNANTITAACSTTSPACSITDGLELTVSAPTGSLAADGTAKPATTNYDDVSHAAFPTEPTIQYQTKTGDDTWGTATTDAPTAAGTYKAGITVGDATACVIYTITSQISDTVAVTGIDAPVGGSALDTSAATSASNVTLSAVSWNPSDTTAAYNTAYTATITATAGDGSVFSDSIAATVNGSAASSTSLSDDRKTLTITYEFPATGHIPVRLSNLYATDITYGQTLSDSQIYGEAISEADGMMVNGSFAWDTADINKKPSVSDSDSTTYAAVFTPSSSDYQSVDFTVSLTVNKAVPSYTAPTAVRPTYSGSASNLVTAGSCTEGEIQFSTSQSGTYSATIPQETEAGDYTVWWKIVGDENHSNTDPAQVSNVAILPKEVTVSGITAWDKVYDGTTDTTENLIYEDVTFGGLVSGDKLTVTATGTFEDKNVALDKEITLSNLTLGGTDAGNYTLAESGNQATVTSSITQRPVKVVSGITASDKDYDGTTDVTLDCTNAVIDGKLDADDLTVTATGHFEDADATDGTTPRTVCIDSLTLGGNDAGNYMLEVEGNQSEAAAAINPLRMTVSDEGFYGTYDGQPHGITVTVTKPTEGYTIKYYSEETNTYDLDESPTFTDVSEHEHIVRYQVTAPNYETVQNAANVSIDKARHNDVSVSVSAKYGASCTVDFTDKIEKGGSTRFAGQGDPGGILDYDKPIELEQGKLSFTLVNDKEKVGGTAFFEILIERSTNYLDYNIYVPVTLIDKTVQDLAFASDSVKKAYGDAPFTNALSGAKTDVTYAIVTDPATGVASVDAGTGKVTVLGLGTATITATAAEDSDYLSASKTYTLTIGKGKATVAADNKSKVYGEKDPALTATVTGAVNGDKLEYSLAREAGETAGTYAIKVKLTEGSAVNAKYTITATNGVFTISPAPEEAKKEDAQNSGDMTFVRRCYQIVLGREPGNEEHDSWAQQLASGKRGAVQVVTGFFNSPEYKRQNHTHEDTVRRLYRAMLDREPDPEGLKNWTKALDNGDPVTRIINAMAKTDRFFDLCDKYGVDPGLTRGGGTAVAGTNPVKIREFVTGCYKALLGRGPDKKGLENWVNAILAGKYNAVQVIAGFTGSQEYKGRKLDNAQAVEALYRAMLGRGADPAGLAQWKAKLDAGNPLASVINGIAGSNEFAAVCKACGIPAGRLPVSANAQQQKPASAYTNTEKIRAFVEHSYEAILGRKGDPEGINNHAGAILSGKSSPQQTLRSFLSSAEFKGKNHGNEELVRILYKAYLYREADPTGLAKWKLQLDGGQGLDSVIKGFEGSAEFKAILNGLK